MLIRFDEASKELALLSYYAILKQKLSNLKYKVPTRFRRIYYLNYVAG